MEGGLIIPMISHTLLRDKVVEIGRRMHENDLIAGTDGNISCRLPDGTLLITPAGVAKGRMSPDDLLEIDMQGNVIAGSGTASSEFRMHATFYSIRTDMQAVVHAHPVYCTAFAAASKSMPGSVLPEIVMTIGEIPLAKYSTPSTSDLADSIQDLIKEHDVILLDHHGLVAAGRNLEEAYNRLELAEHYAKILHAAEDLGGAKSLTAEQLAALDAVRKRSGANTSAKSAVRQAPSRKD